MLNRRDRKTIINYITPFLIIGLMQIIPIMGKWYEPSGVMFASMLCCYAITSIAYAYAALSIYSYAYYALLGMAAAASIAHGLSSMMFLDLNSIGLLALFGVAIGHSVLHSHRIHSFMTITSDVVQKGMHLGFDETNANTCLTIGYVENMRLVITLFLASALMFNAAPSLGIVASTMVAIVMLLVVFFICGFLGADIAQLRRLSWVSASTSFTIAMSALVVQGLFMFLIAIEGIGGGIDAVVTLPALMVLWMASLITVINCLPRK